jgi:hypothetical protein
MGSALGREEEAGATRTLEKDKTTKEWRLVYLGELAHQRKAKSGRLNVLTVAVALGVAVDTGRRNYGCRGQVQVPFRLDLRVRSKVARRVVRGSRKVAGWAGERGDVTGG